MSELRFVGHWHAGWQGAPTRAKAAAWAALAVAMLAVVFGDAAAQTALEDSVGLRLRPDYDPMGIIVGPRDSLPAALEESVARRLRPDYDPIGIVVGPRDSFLLYPKL
ncbi:MAG: hypothetical protein ACE5LF_01740, partial [Alphaproteobacteria bacterium]